METTTPEVPTVDLTNLATREDLTALESRMSTMLTPPAPVERIHVREQLSELVRAYGNDPTQKSLLERADMVSSGNTGLTSTARTSKELIEYFDSMRYFLGHVDKIPFPETGIIHTLPSKTQRSQVGTSAEKVAPPSRAITTTTTSYTGVWYKGWLDISYELIRTSSPGAVAVAVDDMLGEAAVDSEKRFISAVETAATEHTALDFTDYKAFVKSVRSAVRVIRGAAGKSTPTFALTQDSWDELLTFVDAVGRRNLSVSGPQNADGSALLTAEEVTLAGILFFESPHSAVDVAFNANSLKASELPPMQLAADNPQLVGRDVAILGNIMAIPRLPGGVLSLDGAPPLGASTKK